MVCVFSTGDTTSVMSRNILKRPINLSSGRRFRQLLRLSSKYLWLGDALQSPSGHVFVIDWDEVMLAPPERDFIFIRGPQADGFWKGYGAGDIDWTALTYFLWERVVQDFIEYARCVCFREDLSEETKADLAQMFESSLTTENNNLNAAYAAAARLNRGL